MNVEYLDRPGRGITISARTNADYEGPKKHPNVSKQQPEAVASKPRCGGNPCHRNLTQEAMSAGHIKIYEKTRGLIYRGTELILRVGGVK